MSIETYCVCTWRCRGFRNPFLDRYLGVGTHRELGGPSGVTGHNHLDPPAPLPHADHLSMEMDVLDQGHGRERDMLCNHFPHKSRSLHETLRAHYTLKQVLPPTPDYADHETQNIYHIFNT